METGPHSWETLPADVLEIVFSKIENTEHLGPLRLVNSCWCNVINRSLKSLRIKRKKSVGDIESLGRTFTRLARLEMYSTDEDIFCKLSSIESLTELDVKLSWSLCERSNFRSYGVELLTNLSTLNIFWSVHSPGLKHMEMLCTLPNLKSLSLKKGSRIADTSIEQLSSMTNLTSLDLHMFSLTSVDFLSSLTNLEVLNLGKWRVRDVDVTPLTSLVKLTRLDLKKAMIGRSEIKNVVVKLQNLTWLDLKINCVKNGDLATLAGLSKLTHLDLSHNFVSSEGVCSLTGLVSLQRLFLNETCVTDAIQLLVPLTGLEVLHLDNCPTQVSELVGLSNLVGLREVSVRHLTGGMDRRQLEELSASVPSRIKFKGLSTRLLFV